MPNSHTPETKATSFSAKEKDEETQYSYFGARYYMSDISVWLSVDPMADKYPSLSPFMYCAGNPVILVDPNGQKIVITGEAKKQYYNQVKVGAKSLGVSVKMDKTGTLSAKYKGKGVISEEGLKLLTAINDKNITVNINATYSDYVDGKPFIGGAFMGNEISGEKATAYQTVNPNDLQKLDDFYGTPGQSSLHEATEPYQGAVISLEKGISSGDANSANSVYQQAHNEAIPLPFENLDKYNFDINGNQSNKTGLPAISVGWFFNNTNIKIKEVDY